MVWEFCTTLRWPEPTQAPMQNDYGISWTELACSFMLWSNRLLPVRLRHQEFAETVPYHDPKVQLLPVKSRSLRVLAENFRWTVKHLQTFSRTQFIPSYKKQGTSSLTRLGFTPYHEGGISRRPTLPNPVDTYTYLEAMLMNMPHDPPYHTEILPPPLPPDLPHRPWPTWEEIPPQKNEKFLQNMRNALFRKKHYDSVRRPDN